MAMDLNDLDVEDDDVIETPETHTEDVQLPEEQVTTEESDEVEEEEQPLEQDNNSSSEEPDALKEFLKNKGIDDYTKIKFENEDGTIEEVSWDSLTEEEKLNILNTQEDNSDTDLDDSEIDLINRLRLSQMSVEDFINAIKQQGASEYAKSIQDQQEEEVYNYTVDDLSDEELYVLDLQARIADISDEELSEALDRAKANEVLFKKEVDGLREDYKRMEDERNQQQEAIAEQKRQEQFAAFSSSIVDGINSFNNIGELDVDMNDDDKNELYDFITGVDNAGINHFAKALNDPDTIVRTAWFALHGEDIINSISDYYKTQIQAVAKANYERGLADAKPKRNTERKVVVKKQQTSSQEQHNVKSIDDLD